eukprot:COSAG05_NODE_7055_length_861_cov_6.968504_1_plen_269_part_10
MHALLPRTGLIYGRCGRNSYHQHTVRPISLPSAAVMPRPPPPPPEERTSIRVGMSDEPRMARGVMGNQASDIDVMAVSQLERTFFQLDALMMKNIWQLQARFPSLAVVMLAAGGGVLLVELLRYEVERASGGGSGNDAARASAGLILSIMTTLATLVHMNTICGEKHLGLTGAMRMIGLSEGAYWCAYLVLFALTAIVGALIAAAIMLLTQVTLFRNTNYGVSVLVTFFFIVSMSSGWQDSNIEGALESGSLQDSTVEEPLPSLEPEPP